MMNLLHAEAFLNNYGSMHVKLADVYDDDEMLRSVLAVLFPGFEYPDFSYLTIGELVRRYKANPQPMLTA